MSKGPLPEYLSLEDYALIIGWLPGNGPGKPDAHEAMRKRCARLNAARPRAKRKEPLDLGDGWVAVRIGARGDWRVRRA